MLPPCISFNGPMSKHGKYYVDPDIISAEAVFDNNNDIFDDNFLFISVNDDTKYICFNFDVRNSNNGFKRYFGDRMQNNKFSIDLENNKLTVYINDIVYDVTPNDNVDNGYKPNVVNFILGKKALKRLNKFLNNVKLV